MKEQLISFETAKLAKEKGFNCYVNYFYEDKNGYPDFIDDKDNWNLYIDFYSAPTQSLLQKWLREKHFICVEVTLNFTNEEYDAHYNVGIMSNIKHNTTNTWHRFDCSCSFYKTYEEALEEGLKSALKLIK